MRIADSPVRLWLPDTSVAGLAARAGLSESHLLRRTFGLPPSSLAKTAASFKTRSRRAPKVGS